MFDSFYSLAMLLGAVITLVGLGFMNTRIYFLILITFSAATAIFGFFVLEDIETIGQKHIK